MNMGITILSEYLVLSTQPTAVPLGAGRQAALSVMFQPSTKSLLLQQASRTCVLAELM
jgi:hypothetical protein